MLYTSRNRWLLVAIALLAPLAMLMIPYVQRMWGSGHYQYFPLILVAIAQVCWHYRHQVVHVRRPGSTTLFYLGTVTSLGLTLVGNFLNSGFVGILGVVFAIALLFYGMAGKTGLRVVLPGFFLFVFVIPLPLNLDRALIFEMQFFSSQLASWLLDGIGFIHFREGVILMTESSRYLTEEACSGVRSLFSSIAVVAVISIFLKHNPGRIVGNLLQTIFWVVIGNAIRVALVVFVADRHSDWVTKGIGHDLVGVVLFGFILLMVASTDALVRLGVRYFLFGTFAEPPQQEEETEAEPPQPAAPVPCPVRDRGLVVLLSVSVVCTLISFRVAQVRRQDNSQAFKEMPRMVPASSDDMPETLLGWIRTEFEHVHRELNFFQADDSYIWTYRKGSIVAYVSLDGPWAEWHDLGVCYRGLGWQTEADYFTVLEEDVARGDSEPLRHSELKMARDFDHGFVVFSSVDRQGNEMLPEWRSERKDLGNLFRVFLRQAARALGTNLAMQVRLSGNELPATTIQVFAAGDKPFTSDDYEEIRGLFDESRDLLMQLERFN